MSDLEQNVLAKGYGFPERFVRWSVRARWTVIAASLLVAGAFGSGIVYLQPSTDYRIFFNDDNPELLKFETLENTYEKSDNVLLLIVPDNRDATSKDALAAAIWLTEQAWLIPHASRVDSIANFQVMSAQDDDLDVRSLVDPDKIGEATERLNIRETALGDPRLAGSLLSQDGSVSAVHVTIKLPNDGDFVSTAKVAEYTRSLLEKGSERFADIDFRPLGIVMINHGFNEETAATAQNVVPLSLIVMALILLVLTRGLAGVVVTGAVVVLTIVAAMGLSGWVDIPYSTSTATAPVILLTIAVANCMHILVATQRRLGVGDSKSEAVIQSTAENFRSIFLACATSAFGFAMMNFSEVPPYRHLGTLVASGTAFAFLFSVSFYPALLSLIALKAHKPKQTRFGMEALAELVIRRKRLVIFGSAVVIIGLISGVPRNELNDVVTEFFDKDTELRQDADFLDENLSGNTVIEYSISAEGPGQLTDPDFLKDVDAFTEWYRSQPEVRHVFAISDTFKQLNKSMHGDDPAAYRIPENRNLASQYLLLYEFSLPFGLDLNNRIDVSKSSTRLTVSAATLSTAELLELDERAKSWLDNNTQSFSTVQSSGAALMFAHLGEHNIRGMMLGTVIAFLGISCILVAALRSLRIGLMSLVSNFAPGLMAFGIWGLTVGEIGLALSVVMAMTIGIVVDDTVHFLERYLHARRKQGMNPEDAIRHAFATVGRALAATTVILVAGFLVLGWSSFLPTAQMGQLTAIVIGLALICDLFLLPPLLMIADRKAKV